MAESSDSADGSSRFLKLKSNDKKNIMDERFKQNTRKATQTWLKCINDYVKERKMGNTLDEVSSKDLPDVLYDFYAEVRSTKKQRYKNTTLKCLRAGINRHIKETRSIDIVSDPQFIKCNELFKGVQKVGKKEGKGSIKHKDVIESEDMERLRDYFSKYMTPDAVIFQKFVMFNIMFYMCRRGCENFAEMTVDTFEVREFFCRKM